MSHEYPPAQPQWQPPTQPPVYPPGYSSGYPPAYPAYPSPPALPSFPHAEPQPYHLMLRTWTYAWWKPVVGIVIALAGMLLIAPLVLLPVLALGVALEDGPFWQNFRDAATLKAVSPAALFYLNLVLGSMILLTWFIMRVVHRMRPRWLASVVPKMRWTFFLACLGLAVVALVAQVVVGTLVPTGGGEGDLTGKLNDFTASTVAVALVVLLTTPLQAAGEEYLFRGYLLQAVGSLFRNRWVAIVATATLFALAHGAQNFPLFFDRFAFGLIAGWLVTKTGGLEAGIALHILNNFLAFGLALSFGDLTETLTVSEVSWWNIVLTVTQSGVYTVLVLLVARRMGLQSTTRPPFPDSREAVTQGAVTA
jgi:membrane protease YdiL (CAAX protease family)